MIAVLAPAVVTPITVTLSIPAGLVFVTTGNEDYFVSLVAVVTGDVRAVMFHRIGPDGVVLIGTDRAAPWTMQMNLRETITPVGSYVIRATALDATTQEVTSEQIIQVLAVEPTPSVVSLTPSDVSLSSNVEGTMTVHLDQEPLITPAVVTLSVSDLALTVPPTVTVPAGQLTATFQIVGFSATPVTIELRATLHTGTAIALVTLLGAAMTTLAPSTYTVTGSPLGTIWSGSPNKFTVLESGTYTVTGTPLSFKQGYVIALGSGSYAVTGSFLGTSANAFAGTKSMMARWMGGVGLKGFSTSLQSGTYTITGTAFTARHTQRISLNAGQYSISGSFLNTIKTGTNPILFTVNGLTGSQTLLPGATLTVQVTNGPGNLRDWVAIYTSGTPNSAFFQNWQYLNGSQTAPTSPITNATLTFIAPSIAGPYDVRFLTNDSFNSIASCGPITVAIAVTDLQPSAGQVGVGNQLTYTVVLSGPPSVNSAVTLLSSNTSIATVPSSVTVLAGQNSASFQATGVTLGNCAVSASFGGVTIQRTLTVTTVSQTGLVTFSDARVGQIAGPLTVLNTPTSATVPLIATWEALVKLYIDSFSPGGANHTTIQQIQAEDPTQAGGPWGVNFLSRNYYYDLAFMNYQYYYRTGNTVYRDRGRQIAQDYITYGPQGGFEVNNLLTIANGGPGSFPPPRDSALLGMAMFYLDTGNTTARQLVINYARCGSAYGATATVYNTFWDIREHSYTLMNTLAAIAIGDTNVYPFNNIAFQGNFTFAQIAAQLRNHTFNMQGQINTSDPLDEDTWLTLQDTAPYPDAFGGGQTVPNTPWSNPFMIGLLTESLILAERVLGPDVRTDGAMVRWMNWCMGGGHINPTYSNLQQNDSGWALTYYYAPTFTCWPAFGVCGGPGVVSPAEGQGLQGINLMGWSRAYKGTGSATHLSQWNSLLDGLDVKYKNWNGDTTFPGGYTMDPATFFNNRDGENYRSSMRALGLIQERLNGIT